MENRWKGKLGESAKILLPDTKAAAVLLLIILGLGAALRIYKLNSSLWVDEIVTVVKFVEKPLWYIVSHYPVPNNHILNSILAHISISLFGESEITLRLAAFLMGLLSIPLIYKVARELFDEKVGLISSFLLSISVFHILHSQNARGYSGLVFFSLLSLLFLLKAIKRGNKRYWVGFVLATVLNVYNLPLGLIVLGIEISFFLVILIYISPLRADVRLLKRFLLSVGAGLLIIFLLYLPVLSEVLSAQVREVGEHPPQYNLSTFKRIFFSFFLGPQQPGLWRWRNLYLFFFLFLTGVFASFKEYQQSIVLCLFWALSLFIAADFLPDWPRAYIFTLPIYLIVISKGVTSIGILLGRLTKLSQIHKRAESVVICILALALSGPMGIAPLRRYYSESFPMENWKGVAQYLKEHVRPGDGVYVKPPWPELCLSLDYYLRDTNLSWERIPEPLPEGYLTIWHMIPSYWIGHEDERAFCKKSGLALRKTFEGRWKIEVWALRAPTANLRLLRKIDFEITRIPKEWAQANNSGRMSVNIDSEICREGTRSVKLVPQTDELNFELFSEFFEVEPGKVLFFSGNARREEDKGNVGIAIWFFDVTKEALFRSDVLSDPLNTKKEWVRLGKIAIVPARAVYARIGLRVWDRVGTENIIHFDDIKIYMGNDRDDNAN